MENMVERKFWESKKILVTGATGFVGSNLVRTLVKLGSEITIIERDLKKQNPLVVFGIGNQLNTVLGDITDLPFIERVINEYEIEILFHLAAQPIVGAANRSPLPTLKTNIIGTWNILEACRLSKTIKAAIIASSDKAYGDQKKVPYKEEQPLLGIYPYDASKACADILARSFAKTFQLPIAVTRFANIYGEGDFHLNRIVPGTIVSLINKEIPIIRSDGTLKRDYLYVSDAISGYLVLAEAVYNGQHWSEAFNFGTGSSIPVIDLFSLMIKISKRKVKPKILGEASNEILDQSLDYTKAKQLLGWKPTISLAAGLKKTFAWYKKHSKLFSHQ